MEIPLGWKYLWDVYQAKSQKIFFRKEKKGHNHHGNTIWLPGAHTLASWTNEPATDGNPRSYIGAYRTQYPG
jgi:hypothetical protein